MASTLMMVCMSLQDDYGQRFEAIGRRIEALQVRDSPYGRELSRLRSLYATIVVAAIAAMPQIEREDAARRQGQTIDNMFHLYNRNEEQKSAKQVAALVD